MNCAGLAFDFETYRRKKCELVEERLTQYLAAGEPLELSESMRYSVLSGGKRIRAVLCLAAAEAASECFADKTEKNPWELALPLACSIEFIHAMSLIHDDLPCMDDDDFRRGKPSNHKVFGEAIALLAGDALLVYAFELLLKESSEKIAPRNLIRVARDLGAATGAKGMVGGQVFDMSVTGMQDASEREKSQSNEALLSKIHELKTGALIRFAVCSGAALMDAPEAILIKLAEFGDLLGLSFQIADDLLDVTGDIKTLGKTPGKDEKAGKLTWISVYGIESAKKKLAELEVKGNAILCETGLTKDKLAPLAALLKYAIHRSH